LRPIRGGEHAQDVSEVFVEQRIGGDVAQNAFPNMAVRVDESRHHDHRRGIDDLRFAHLQVGTHRDDLRAVDEHVGAPEVADLSIHREDTAVLEYFSFGCHSSPFVEAAQDESHLISSCPNRPEAAS